MGRSGRRHGEWLSSDFMDRVGCVRVSGWVAGKIGRRVEEGELLCKTKGSRKGGGHGSEAMG